MAAAIGPTLCSDSNIQQGCCEAGEDLQQLFFFSGQRHVEKGKDPRGIDGRRVSGYNQAKETQRRDRRGHQLCDR